MKMNMSKVGTMFLALGFAAAADGASLDTAQIDAITGLKDKLNPEEDVHEVTSSVR